MQKKEYFLLSVDTVSSASYHYVVQYSSLLSLAGRGDLCTLHIQEDPQQTEKGLLQQEDM